MVRLSDKPSGVEGFPLRKWNVKVYVLDQAGKEHKADCFTKVVFNLHPSFENPVQSKFMPADSPIMDMIANCSRSFYGAPFHLRK